MRLSLDAEVDEFRTRPLGWQRWCYLWLDATWVKCRVEGRSVSQAIVTAIALGEDGCKHFCGADVMDTESYADWDRFLANLRDRGLDGSSSWSPTPTAGSSAPSPRGSRGRRGSAATST